MECDEPRRITCRLLSCYHRHFRASGFCAAPAFQASGWCATPKVVVVYMVPLDRRKNYRRFFYLHQPWTWRFSRSVARCSFSECMNTFCSRWEDYGRAIHLMKSIIVDFCVKCRLVAFHALSFFMASPKDTGHGRDMGKKNREQKGAGSWYPLALPLAATSTRFLKIARERWYGYSFRICSALLSVWITPSDLFLCHHVCMRVIKNASSTSGIWRASFLNCSARSPL